MPTGSGKTQVQGLLAVFYANLGMKVTIIEPTEDLRIQATELLGVLDYNILVCSIEQYYEVTPTDEVIIVDEYDYVVVNNPFTVNLQGITGLWTMTNRKVFLFSATSNAGLEKIIFKVFGQPAILKFKSEYEVFHNCSNVNQGVIKPAKTVEEALDTLKNDL